MNDDYNDPKILLELGQRNLQHRLKGLSHRALQFSANQVVYMHQLLDDFARHQKPAPKGGDIR